MTTLSRGFTLIELMIVVAIIAVIAAIAIPNLIRSRILANEGTAIANLRTLHSAQSAFKLAQILDIDGDGAGEYTDLATLSAQTPRYIDQVLGSGRRGGYSYAIELTGVTDSDEVMWAASAWPVAYAGSGVRTFYIDESGVLRGSDTAGGPVLRIVAEATFPPISS